MFQKPTFGSGTSNFGSFNTTAASPFGGFKSTAATSAFGAPPAFGATAAPQPATGGGLFGSTNTTGGLFGNTSAPTSSSGFGASTSSFGGFGATTSTGSGLFGGNTSSGLFGNQPNQSAFGAKPTGFGFGGTTTTGTTGGGLFGSTQQTTGTGLFGQQTNTLGGGGLFSNTTSAFGAPQQPATGTAHVKYSPVVGTDVVVKAGASQNVNIKHHCITCMKDYEGKSLEELRLEDYAAGRKGQTGGMFGGFQQQTETKPLFGPSTSFSQTATTSATPSVFGGGGLSTTGFGQTSSFSFGSNAQNNATTSGGLFGANKPTFGATPTTGTGLFGATTTQAGGTAFGTTTPAFGGFGTTTQNQSGGLFGAKPATTGFGTTQANTGFGSFGSGGGLFGAKTTTSTFGTATPAFGTLGSSTFGTNTSASGGLFGGNSTFGKPATSQPFGLNMQPTLGLGTSLGTNTFQAKPTGSAFGTLGTTNMFGQTQTAPATNFKTGLDSGLGGGLFSNSTSLGGSALGLGGSALGLGGLNANNNPLANNTITGGSAAGNVHEQILNLAARPYGDSALFKDLLPDSAMTSEEVLKPTNPVAVQAVLDSTSAAAYRVTSPTHVPLKLQPRPRSNFTQDKKSLFEGLEESDASLEDKLCLKPSRKRLVLRPNQKNSNQDSIERNRGNETTVEEPRPTNAPTGTLNNEEKEASSEVTNKDEVDRVRRQVQFNESGADKSSDRQGNWLMPSKASWNEKEKSIDDEPTPRLYPNIEKDLQTQASERRASWLTTKPLRKPSVNVNMPESVENTVRELGLRTGRSHDKENVDTLSVTEEETLAPREVPPHPTGVKLTRPGYYTIPSLDEMIDYLRSDGTCVVPYLTIGRKKYGNVFYDSEIDVYGMDLDNLVHFLNKEVIVYPEEADKPPLGSGLNRRAIVTLDRVWPRDKTEKRPITEPERLLKMDYEGKLRRVCDKHDTKFIEYRPATGSWVFRVEHFSKYGLNDSDEEDDVPDVIRRQLVQNATQGQAAVTKQPALAVPATGTGGIATIGALIPEDNMLALQQTSVSLNLPNGSKAFEMDVAEDTSNETQSLYLDNRAYGVKSPTSELARLERTRSHNVQLMKASLYADAEMDAESVSTGDQLVPTLGPLLSVSSKVPSLAQEDTMSVDVARQEHDELPMRPLIIRPHTIVLKYHRKVPPFKNSIAGRLNAAYIADMSVCRARHSRAGFGPGSTLVFATSYDSCNDLSPTAELCQLDKYVQGRSANDWSEPVVLRMALGQKDKNDGMQEMLKRHLASLMEHSNVVQVSDGQDICPQLCVSKSPQHRLSILYQYMKHSANTTYSNKFGVSAAYCHEVWQLCDALWGQDLENDGVASTDLMSIVSRHKKLLDWFKSAVGDVTDQELSKPQIAEERDETDGHSAQIWTLLVGGRALEACKLARKHGDLNMAMLIAQASGDPSFRSLIARQLSLWRECGADTMISSYRWASLQLISGQSTPRDKLVDIDWLRALHATARYLCPHVPSLEHVMRKYEGFFVTGDIEDEIDLSVVKNTEMDMKLPLPPHVNTFNYISETDESSRRDLDLRYELLRARAYNDRPRLRPASYTPDPMDFTLCFLLGAWFGSPSVESITGIADQLEAAGDWHLAVQALAYHPNDTARGHLIRGVLSRHAPARVETPQVRQQLELIEKLQVPRKWLLLAQAHRAKYLHLPSLEAEYLVGAGEWNAAHKILLDELLPEAVLADDLQSISSLLDQMNEAASRHEVSGWENGGKALHHYLHVCDEIRGLVSEAEAGGDRSSVHTRLEALRPRVAAACRALGGLHPKSARGIAARAEMGARLVQLSLAAGEPPAHTAALLRTLRLPPDTTPQAHHKICTLLAERASTPPAVCAT